jgi:WD40 repeat protein
MLVDVVLWVNVTDATRPCGIIGKLVSNSGCVRSFNNGSSVAFLPDGQTLAREDFQDIVLSPLNYQFWQTEVLKHDDYVQAMALSPDGKTIVSVTRGWAAGTTIWLWDVESNTLLNKHPNFSGDVNDIAFSRNGEQFALVRNFSQVEIWDIESWQPVFVTEGYYSAAISPDNSVLATFLHETVKLIDLRSGEIISVLEMLDFVGSGTFGNDLVFSSDGRYLAANSHFGSIYVWRLEDNQLIFSDHPYPFRVTQSNGSCQIAFSPDNKLVANCYYTREDRESFVDLYRVEGGALLRTIELGNRSVNRAESVSFSPNGDMLAIGTPDETMIYSLSSK